MTNLEAAVRTKTATNLTPGQHYLINR